MKLTQVTILAAMAIAASATAAPAQVAFPGTAAPSADDPWTPKVAKPRPKPAAAKPTGMCTVMREGKVVDQQSCAAVRPASNSGETFYQWPTGNKTTVGGTDEDFTVNGNIAAPNADDQLGLCLKVEKTGNTFCYKEGAKPGTVTAAATTPANVQPAAPAVQQPAATKAPDTAALAEEARLRIAAEEKIAALEAEVVRLKEAEAKHAEDLKRANAEASKREEEATRASEAAAMRAKAVLAEIDRLQPNCAQRNAEACSRALTLMNEAVVTGAVDVERRRELERLQSIALAPFGIPSLRGLSSLPVSTWVSSIIAALLAMTLLITRKSNRHGDPAIEIARPAPSLEMTLPSTPPPLPPTALIAPPAIAEPFAYSQHGVATANVFTEQNSHLTAAVPPMSTAGGQTTPSARTAFILNLLLPGSGNAYFGQRAMSGLLLLAIFAAMATPFAPDHAMMMGIGLAGASLLLAFFTSGLSLLIGIPTGILFVLQPASLVLSAAVWLYSLCTAQLLLKRRA